MHTLMLKRKLKLKLKHKVKRRIRICEPMNKNIKTTITWTKLR